MTAVRHGIRRVAVRLGFPLHLEVVNEAVQSMLLSACATMTRGYVLLDPCRGEVYPYTEQQIHDGLPGLSQECLEFLLLGELLGAYVVKRVANFAF